jgi:hypothetical protein
MREVTTSMIKFITKLISVILAILFVLSTSIILLILNIESTLLNAEMYTHALEGNGVYQQLPLLAKGETRALKAFLTNQTGIASKNLDFMNNLSTEDWQRLLNLVLPPDEARAMVESLLDQVFSTITGKTDTTHLSLVVVKTRLAGQAGKESIQYLLNTQPPCTEEQIQKIHSEKAGDTGQLVYCSPPQQDQALLTSLWQAKLESVSAAIPDQVLIETPFKVFVERIFGKNPISRLNTVRLITEFSPILPLFLLLMLTLFAVRSLKGWLLWWGIPLFITGIIVTAISLATLPLLNSVWVNYIFPQLPKVLSSGITSLIRNLLISVGRAFAIRIFIQAVVIGLFGWAAIISPFFLTARIRQSAFSL